jgi:hypothetical protein
MMAAAIDWSGGGEGKKGRKEGRKEKEAQKSPNTV